MDVKIKMKLGGHRSSTTREHIVEILQKTTHPLTVPELLKILESQGTHVNKTTVYRELEKLENHNIVQSVILEGDKIRYELNINEHHHHLVCTICNKIEDIELKGDLAKVEKIIEAKNSFKITKHSLEFFGVCKSCLY